MEDNILAKKGNGTVYRLTALLTVLTVILGDRVTGSLEAVMVLYLIFSIFLTEWMSRNEDISIRFHGKVLVVFYSIAAFFIGVETAQTGVYIMLLMLPVFMALLYVSRKVFAFTIVALLLQFTILLVLDFPYMSGRPGTAFCFIFYLLLCLCWAVVAYLISIVEFRERINYEQECSLDDMLKVISAKCEEAKSATRSKSDFLSHMSHEIRTPINAILGMNEMILRESTEENIQSYAADVESAGSTLLSLINDILDFSKIESGKMEIVLVEYMVSSIVNDLVNLIRPKLALKQLQFKVEINPDMPDSLLGDDVRVKQVMVNLLSNAVKYTEKGTVTFSVDYQEAEGENLTLVIRVADTGCGIREEDLEKIFLSFQRVDEKRNRAIEGTGLGLAITNRLLELMDGELKVESEYGKGSVFTAYIPQKIKSRKPVGEFSQKIEKHIRVKAAYEGKFTAPEAKILVVDDNKMNLTVIAQLLKQTDMQIDTAERGEECIALAGKTQYDVILMDHMMPGMDGVETLKHLKEEFPGFRAPVIALTANAIAGARDMYLDYGFQDYLSKPVKGEKLEKMLMKWLPEEKIQAPGSLPVGESRLYQEENRRQAEETGQKNTAWSSFPEEMDVEEAKRYSADGEETGVRMNADLFVKNAPVSRKNLVEAFEEKRYGDYTIYVHSMKSNLALLGAMELSAKAKELEMESREEHFAFVEEHHADYLAEYDSFVQKLQRYLEATDTTHHPEKEEKNVSELAESIVKMSDCYDTAGMQEQTMELAAVKGVSQHQSDVIGKLFKAMEELDFDAVRAAAEELEL